MTVDIHLLKKTTHFFHMRIFGTLMMVRKLSTILKTYIMYYLKYIIDYAVLPIITHLENIKNYALCPKKIEDMPDETTL